MRYRRFAGADLRCDEVVLHRAHDPHPDAHEVAAGSRIELTGARPGADTGTGGTSSARPPCASAAPRAMSIAVTKFVTASSNISSVVASLHAPFAVEKAVPHAVLNVAA